MTDEELREAEDAKVSEALRFAGIRVESVYDLVNSKASYSTAIPLLVRMLNEVQHPRIKEGIARALTVKETRPLASSLVQAFRRITGPNMQVQNAKWAIGNALSVAGSDEVFDDVVSLMRDKSHGWTRSMLPLALVHAKQNRERAVAVLIESLADDELACQAADALARLKAGEGLPYLQRLASSENRDIRKAAIKAVKRLSG